MSQSALSHQIRKLEATLGVVLLERSSRRVALTPEGEAFLPEARATVAAARRAASVARGERSKELVIGFTGSSIVELLTRVLAVWHHQQPGAEVSLRDLTDAPISRLIRGDADLAFTRLTPEETELDVEVLRTEPRVALLPAGHPLGDRQTLRLSELRDQSFITMAAAVNPVRREKWLAEQHRHGLSGRIEAETNTVQEILELVAAGRGICLVPAAAAWAYSRPDVTYVPVSDIAPAVVSLAYPPGPRSPLVQTFTETTRKVVRGSTGR